MTLGQFVNGMGWRLQGNIVVSVWSARFDNEIDRLSFTTDSGLRGYKKTDLKGLLSKEIKYMFANQCGELVIEVEKEEDE